MRFSRLRGRTLALMTGAVGLLAVLIYVGLSSGPMASVAVTVGTVEVRALRPMLFGVGTVEARYTYKIGPTFAGRLERLDVHVGDRVEVGQVLGTMAPVDLDDRIRSQASAVRRAEAVLRESQARQAYAKTQARRYDQLLAVRSTSAEITATKQLEYQIAEAAVSSAREELARARSDGEGLIAQRANLRLVAPTDGIVVLRNAEPGTTVVAGQAVIEVIDPTSLWVNVRFDQGSAAGLAAGLPAQIVLRSRSGQVLTGYVQHVEPMADVVTEETLAKVVFDTLPQPWPPVGELTEVTVLLPTLAPVPSILNAAIRRQGDEVGVWRVVDGRLRFLPIKPGVSDLDGYVQVHEGLAEGEQVVLHSEKALTARSRIHVVTHMVGGLR